MKVLITMWFFLLGSAVGSFLNVVIYRLPRRESIIFPPSHCPSCGHRLLSKDLIPILNYVLLRGKCRYCGTKISPRYILVELISGLYFALVFYFFGFSFFTFKSLIFFSLLLPVFFIDLEHMIIPDIISIPGIFIGLILSLFNGNLKQSIFGSVFYGGVLLFIYVSALLILKEEGMGQGDIKLGFMIGSFLGFKLSILSLFLSYFIGGLFSIALMGIKRKDLKTAIPFGPFLIFSAFISMFWGEMILNFYFSFFK